MQTDRPALRPVRVAVACVAGMAIVLAGIALANFLWHEYQVQAHKGVWCVQTELDGKAITRYGADCQSPK